MQKITPFLWFDGNAEDAMNFYVSVFPNSKILDVSRYTEAGPLPEGTVLVCRFQILGMEFMALNGGPEYQFNNAVSFMIDCETQEEVDRYWKALTADGGKEIMCGWLTDKFGLAWQVTPRILGELVSDPDREKANRVMKAMMGMVKIDIEGLKRAAAGETVGT